MKIHTLIALSLTALLAVGCGGSKKSLGEVDVDVPSWFAAPPTSDTHLYGVANEKAQNMQTAIDKAKHTATLDIAQKLETHVKGLTKRFVQDIGEGITESESALFESVSKNVVNTKVMGVQVKEQKIKQNAQGLFSVYILMEMPLGEANKALMAQLKAQEALRIKLEASKAFKELDEEIAKTN
jgi:hypothetical protein